MSLFVDVKEEMGKTVVEAYGGFTNTILIISGCLIVIGLTFILINKELKKVEIK